MTCSQRPTTTSTSRRPAVRVSRRHGATGPVTCRYHYYVIDDLVDEARRQGACHACLSSARPAPCPLAGWSAFGL
eukprot:1945722-Prymnesium_polylepis.1